MTIDWGGLQAPFAPQEVGWRIGRSGCKKDGNVWALCLAYVTNRAIQQRLDDVIGPGRWKNEYATGPAGGVICGLSIRCETPPEDELDDTGYEWVTKWDGAEARDIEAVKSALSDSMKRAACQWGIGRYLYDLEEGWAEVSDNKMPGAKRAKCQGPGGDKWFFWLPPKLPRWALPNNTSPSGSPAREVAKQSAVEEEPQPVDKLNTVLMEAGCKGPDEANKVVEWLWDGTKSSIGEIRDSDALVDATLELVQVNVKKGIPIGEMLVAALEEGEEI